MTDQTSDRELLDILQNSRTIAVVGFSDNPERESPSVAAYLHRQGYHIIPVNPNLAEGLGEKAYPDLPSVPVKVDVVLIFRKPEAVPEIVSQAIAIGAKAVWMQDGIIHEAAAQSARQAGLKVVMDTCMRTTHRRLIGS